MINHNHTPHQHNTTAQVEGPERVASLVLRTNALLEELVLARTAPYKLPPTCALTFARRRTLSGANVALLEN